MFSQGFFDRRSTLDADSTSDDRRASATISHAQSRSAGSKGDEMRGFIVTLLALLVACAPTVDGTELGGIVSWDGLSPGAGNEGRQ